MTTDATETGSVRTVHTDGAPYPPDFWLGEGEGQPGAPGAHRAPDDGPVQIRAAIPDASARGRAASVQRTSAPDAPAGETPGTPGAPAGAPAGARRVHRLSALLPHRARPTDAPVHDAGDPGAPADTAPGAPAPTVVRTAPAPHPRRRTARTGAENTSLGEQWGKLTQERGHTVVIGLRVLVCLIVVSLVGVVVAPPALSAHDIIGWAQSHSPDAGLGLSFRWAWVTFLALDFAAGVCVLICVYCAIVSTKPGVFALYVWAFAGATAYANWSFGSRPDAPGDAIWFFPAMSLIGPLLLHSVLIFLRRRIKGQQGNKRGQRPSFPLADWIPIFGTPQDTFGAWRTGAMLGIETPDAALWAYRAVSLEANWLQRWGVKSLVRAQQINAFRARLADENLALAIPGLVPDGAFVSLTGAEEAHAPAAPVHGRAAAPGAPARANSGAPAAGDPAVPDAPGQGSAPGAPGAPGDSGAPEPGNATVVNLDAAAHESARGALIRIFEQYGNKFDSWEALFQVVSLSRIEREAGIGKRRAMKAIPHAETILPWADAPDAVEQARKTA